jgi:hypothetical protein
VIPFQSPDSKSRRSIMNPWICSLLIAAAGAVGGLINAQVTDNGFVLPSREHGILCPGAVANVLIGAVSALVSWAFYGSGASIDLAQATERAQISLRLTALAGACLVGVAGARWITSQVDERFFRESVKEAAKKNIPAEKCDDICRGSARQVLEAVRQA